MSGVDVDISGYKLIGCSSTGPTGTRATVPAGVTLEPGEHYLFTNTAASGYSGTVPGDTNYTTGVSDTGGARLVTAADSLTDAWGRPRRSPTVVEGAGLTLPTSNGKNAF